MVYLLFFIGFGFLLIIYLYYSTTSVVLERVVINEEEEADKIRLIHLSDFHYYRTGRLEKKVLSILEKEKADMIVMTGDYLKTDCYPGFNNYLQEMNIDCPALAVLGNHDFNHNLNKLEAVLRSAGVTLLRNEGLSMQIRGRTLNIIGIESPDRGYDDLKRASLAVDLNSGYNIVLSHTYHIMDRIEPNNIDLVLAGDTHGGQINIPLVGIKLLKFFFRHDLRYISGSYKKNNTTLYINRGLGTSLLPVRYRSRPEVTLIEL